MVKYKKIYLKEMGFTDTCFVPCEICSRPAVDIHHIESKGMGGSKTKDYIENLIAVCRECHNKCHASKVYNSMAKEKHLSSL
tara:strand:- start:3106 stop:3351 length:246 start_codon:yes stop_codon:yes gene_type:complete